MSKSDEFYGALFRLGSRGGGRFPDPGDLFECVIEDIYTRILSPGDLALDGGAHMGRHAFPMAERVGKRGGVLAVEAHPKLARGLVKRARQRRLAQVEVVSAALCERIGRISFQCVRQHSAYSGIRKRRYDFDDSVQSVDVDATTIDLLMTERSSRRLHFIKLDLEGGEFHAVQGGAATLKCHRPLIVFENDQDRSAENYGYTKEQWFECFERLGYELFTLWGQPYRRADWGRRDIPWYFIAAAAGSVGAEFVGHDLPRILDVYRPIL